jgi:hypothetical protein
MLVRGAQLETERLSLLRVVFQQEPLEECFPLPSKRHRRTVWGTFQRAEKGEVQISTVESIGKDNTYFRPLVIA